MEFTGTHYVEPINGLAKCGECHELATHWLYPTNAQGKADFSSAKPVCATHTSGDIYGHDPHEQKHNHHLNLR